MPPELWRSQLPETTENGIVNTEEQSVIYATDHRLGGARVDWEEANALITGEPE